MASEKITAMPDLAGGQIPTDVLPLVDLSALPPNQNVKSSLNDLFAVVTKNITDRAVRFQAPGSAPTVSVAGQGGLYFDGADFRVSENGAAWASLVTAGLITASGLTQSSARILGRTTAGTGAVEEITVGANLSLAAGSLAVTGVALSGSITTSGLTQSSARILGRTTAGTGAVEEISIGANLTLAGGQLSATGGAAPGGAASNVQYNAGGGTFGGSAAFVFNLSLSPTVDITTTGAGVTALRVTGAAAQTAEIILVRQGGDNTAALLTLQQGVLSSLTNNFPFRFENASGTLIAGIATTPATGNYRFVIPGQNNNTPGYVCGTINSGHGIGVDATGNYLAVFASNAPCLWGDGASGRVVVNSAFAFVFSANPANTPDIGLFRQAGGVLRVTNGTTGAGQLLLGSSSDTASGQLHVISQSTGRNAAQFLSASGSTFAPIVGVVTATTTSADTTHVISLRARSTGTPGVGFGGTINLSAQTSTTNDVQAAEIRWNWTNATHATRTSEVRVSVIAGGSSVDVIEIDSGALTILGRDLRLTQTSGGVTYTGFVAPGTLTGGNSVYTMPPSFPAVSGYVMTCDTFGVLSWSVLTTGADILETQVFS